MILMYCKAAGESDTSLMNDRPISQHLPKQNGKNIVTLDRQINLLCQLSIFGPAIKIIGVPATMLPSH